MFFHHLMAGPGSADVYLQSMVLGLASRARLERVHRRAAAGHRPPRHVPDLGGLAGAARAGAGGVAAGQPAGRRDHPAGRRLTGAAVAALQAAAPARMDLCRAPLLRLTAAAEPGTGRYLALLQIHHLVLDHAGLEMVLGEIAALLAGRADRLPAPLPFRDFVAQARLGVPREEHERYFAALLGDVTEPTAPYGLLDIHRPGRGPAGPAACWTRRWPGGCGSWPGPGGVGGHDLPPGVGAGAGGAGRAGGRGVRHRAARPDERRAGRGPGPRPVHEHAAGPGPRRRGRGRPARWPRCGPSSPGCWPTSTPRWCWPSRPAACRPSCRCSPPAQLPAQRRPRAGTGAAATPRMPGIGSAGQDRTNYPLRCPSMTPGQGSASASMLSRRLTRDRCAPCCEPAWTAWSPRWRTAPDTPLHAVPVLSEAERAQLVPAGMTPRRRCRAVTVPELFGAQAARIPDAVAVVCGDAVVSTGSWRRGRPGWRGTGAGGCGPEQVVGLCLDRGAEHGDRRAGGVAGGAAYLPLDLG